MKSQLRVLSTGDNINDKPTYSVMHFFFNIRANALLSRIFKLGLDFMRQWTL